MNNMIKDKKHRRWEHFRGIQSGLFNVAEVGWRGNRRLEKTSAKLYELLLSYQFGTKVTESES